jgi:carbonic anhydrase
MVASEKTHVTPTSPSSRSASGVHPQPGAGGKFGLAFAALVAAAFAVGGATALAAEPKVEAKDGKGSKGDAVIESELRKALIGKSALTGELLMKTGDEPKPVPEKNAATASGRTREVKEVKVAKEAKDPKSAEASVGKKMPMPAAAERSGAKPAEEGAHGGSVPHGPAAMPAPAAHGSHDHATSGGHDKSAKGKPHWGYTGAIGPDAWGKLSAEFATCSKGRRQSPIDLVDRDLSPLNLERIQFDYAPAAFQVVHNGHTIEVRAAGANQIVARGKNYKLLQFHFHHPAEERFNGKGFALDAHFVHRAEDGELAVVTVLFEEGAANPELQRLWDYMPLDSNDRVSSGEGVTFNPVSMLPADRSKYFQYIGSLTTPPCSEGVVWIVLRQPVSASAEQIALFRKMVGMNARPIQPVNGRLIKAAY